MSTLSLAKRRKDLAEMQGLFSTNGSMTMLSRKDIITIIRNCISYCEKGSASQ